MDAIVKFVQTNPLVALAIAAIALWLLFRPNGLLEGFVTCYYNKTILLKDVSGSQNGNGNGNGNGMSEGVVDLENNRGRLYISINANLPYHKAGVFGTTVSDYAVYLVNRKYPHRKDLPPVFVGYLLRYGDRRYRLKSELLGDYQDYSHLIVVRHPLNENYPDVLVLEGEV